MHPDLPSGTLTGTPGPEGRLADYLASRRTEILGTWRSAVEADPRLVDSDVLSRTQFMDRVPMVLAEFEKRLRQGNHPTPSPPEVSGLATNVQHGEHRWQRGYDLRELLLEWGHLHRCLLHELKAARLALRDLNPQVAFFAQCTLAALIDAAIADSAEEFARLQQKDALRAYQELESTVGRCIQNDARRAVLWRESAHDLRGQLSIIVSAALLLEDSALEEALRAESFEMLQKSTRSLKEMLAGVLENTRMGTVAEERRLDVFDAAALLGGLCASWQPLARERGLTLRSNGPASLPVEGDQGKVQRIAQNLLLNALHHTTRGKVTLTWRESDDPTRWSFQVQDTSPDLPAKDTGPGEQGMTHPPGEGIGLSIVRRLSELLGAHAHTETTRETGTTFTISLPRRYTIRGGVGFD